MDIPTDPIAILLYIVTAVAGLTAGVLGWVSKRGGDNSPPNRTTMSGAAIIDSNAVHGVVTAIEHLTGSHDKKVDIQTRHAVALERQAKALESLLALRLEQDKRRAEEEAEAWRRRAELAEREAEDLRRGKR